MKKTNNTYATRIYEALSNLTESAFANMTTQEVIGRALKNALGVSYSSFSDEETFRLMYFVFMENFLADGGDLITTAAQRVSTSTTKILTSTDDYNNLWFFRTSYSGLPTTKPTMLNSNAQFILQGFSCSSQGKATHDALYILATTTGTNLHITLPEISPSTQFYVAIPNETHSAGATVYQLTSGGTTIIPTNSSLVYLFIATYMQDVTASSTYSLSEIASLSPSSLPNRTFLLGNAAYGIDSLLKYDDTEISLFPGFTGAPIFFKDYHGKYRDTDGAEALDNIPNVYSYKP